MEYKTTIGLEIHVQLKTKSKMFCGCNNKAEEAQPNTLVCPVCLGLPGVLPVANHQAIEWTLKTGLALNGTLCGKSKFDRKHYFYPDLPKGYQISQYDMPFVTGGYLEIRDKEEIKKINLTRVHLEEDAGKLVHSKDASLIDLNRAGTPLMEIVTEPDISSPKEAKNFVQELRAILRFLSVSDANMEKGHLRCDANISIASNQQLSTDKLGTPVEIKNLNSFRMIERALVYEEKRQKKVLEEGGKVVKETRGWNDEKGETYIQRSKESAQDYRYFPEPDLPPFELSGFDLEKIKKEIPELPAEKRERYQKDFSLSSQDAALLSLDKNMAEYFEKVAIGVEPKLAANWIINELKTGGLSAVCADSLVSLLKLLQDGKISGKMAKEILQEMVLSDKAPEEIIEEKGFRQLSSKEDILPIIEKVLSDNPEAVAAVKAGKSQTIGFLVGEVMRLSKGQANPQIVNEILKDKVSK